MSAKSKSIKSDLKKVDAYSPKTDDYDELPELTNTMFDRATYKVGGIEKPAPKRRGLQKTPTKVAVYLRLPPEVIDHFRASGRGWQTKIGSALKDWIKQHPHQL